VEHEFPYIFPHNPGPRRGYDHAPGYFYNLSSVLQTRQDVNLLRLAEQVNEFSFSTGLFLQQITGYLRLAEIWAGEAINLGTAFLYKEVALRSAVLSFQETFLVATLFGLLALVSSIFLLFCGSSSVESNGSGSVCTRRR